MQRRSSMVQSRHEDAWTWTKTHEYATLGIHEGLLVVNNTLASIKVDTSCHWITEQRGESITIDAWWVLATDCNVWTQNAWIQPLCPALNDIICHCNACRHERHMPLQYFCNTHEMTVIATKQTKWSLLRWWQTSSTILCDHSHSHDSYNDAE